MTWVWYGLGFVVLFLLLLFFSTLTITIRYKRENENDRGEIRFSIWKGFITHTIRIPAVEYKGLERGVKLDTDGMEGLSPQKDNLTINKESIESYRDWYHFLVENISHFHRLLRSFFRKVTCVEFVWKSRMGTGDAAEAGILTGVAWSIKTSLVAFFANYINWERPPVIDVIPDFHHSVLDTFFLSIIRFRIGHAIILILRIYLRIRKGRSKQACHNQNIPLKA